MKARFINLKSVSKHIFSNSGHKKSPFQGSNFTHLYIAHQSQNLSDFSKKIKKLRFIRSSYFILEIHCIKLQTTLVEVFYELPELQVHKLFLKFGLFLAAIIYTLFYKKLEYLYKGLWFWKSLLKNIASVSFEIYTVFHHSIFDLLIFHGEKLQIKI